MTDSQFDVVFMCRISRQITIYDTKTRKHRQRLRRQQQHRQRQRQKAMERHSADRQTAGVHYGSVQPLGVVVLEHLHARGAAVEAIGFHDREGGRRSLESFLKTTTVKTIIKSRVRGGDAVLIYHHHYHHHLGHHAHKLKVGVLALVVGAVDDDRRLALACRHHAARHLPPPHRHATHFVQVAGGESRCVYEREREREGVHVCERCGSNK